jgi:two-component sensor histidine kinase
MFSFFNKIFQRINRFGTHPGMDELALRHASMINIFYFFSYPAVIGSMIQTYISDGVFLGNAMLTLTVAYTFLMVFLYNGKFITAEYVIMFICNAGIFLFHNLAGFDGGIYFYLFPLLIMLAFLSDFRRIKHFYLHVITSLLTVLLCILFEKKLFWYEQDPAALKTSFLYNLIASAVLTGMCTFIIIRINYREYINYKKQEHEREENQKRMQTSLREKEMLLAEIHHRVKNNLAVISSLLNLQLNTVSNEYTRQILLESRNRVASMALIHQKLYRQDNAEDVDFDTYIHELVAEIRNSYPFATPLHIQVNITAHKIPLNLTTAIPCGLILNELLSNCYKHAFKDKNRGEINVSFTANSNDPELYELAVNDNGCGLPANFNPPELNSLGITIIESLTQQIDGTLKWESTPETGSSFIIQFRQAIRYN